MEYGACLPLPLQTNPPMRVGRRLLLENRELLHEVGGHPVGRSRGALEMPAGPGPPVDGPRCGGRPRVENLPARRRAWRWSNGRFAEYPLLEHAGRSIAFLCGGAGRGRLPSAEPSPRWRAEGSTIRPATWRHCRPLLPRGAGALPLHPAWLAAIPASAATFVPEPRPSALRSPPAAGSDWTPRPSLSYGNPPAHTCASRGQKRSLHPPKF